MSTNPKQDENRCDCGFCDDSPQQQWRRRQAEEWRLGVEAILSITWDQFFGRQNQIAGKDDFIAMAVERLTKP